MGLVDWYVRKFWGRDYFHKDELKELCDRVRRDESAAKDCEWEDRMESERIRMERATHLILTETENQLRRKGKEIEEFKKKIRDAEELRFCAVKGAQGNLHIASEIAVQVTALRDMLAKLSGSLLGIEADARDKLKALEDGR